MKLWIILGALVIAVLLCDKYKEKLPTPIRQIFALWEMFSNVLGIVMSFIILTVLWIVGFGTYGIITKIITLPKRFKAEPDTYWITATSSTKDSMKHQF